MLKSPDVPKLQAGAHAPSCSFSGRGLILGDYSPEVEAHVPLLFQDNTAPLYTELRCVAQREVPAGAQQHGFAQVASHHTSLRFSPTAAHLPLVPRIELALVVPPPAGVSLVVIRHDVFHACGVEWA
jgi:hypothetical protein